jgi:signal-transduction protein with cAMP-binding, CBS, and nucleotidyltransferase domain
LREFRPELPAIIEAIVNRALEKDPARRYRMGLDMATDLSAAFSHLERPQEDISVKEKFQLARKLDFFGDFPDSEIWEIVSAGVWQQADADATIIRAGELEDWFYILAAGTVRIVKDGDRIGALDAGDCFGEMGYLTQCKRSATVIADSPVTLLKINATLMEQVTQECKLRFATVFLRILCDRLAQTTARLARSRGP